MAADTEGLLKALAIERTHVADVSLGGRIALALALAHPERINWLVVISTSAKRAQRSWWFGPLSLVSRWPPLRSKYAQPWYACRRQRQASNGFDVTARLGEFRAPTLILNGTWDRSVPFALAEELHAGIRDSQVNAGAFWKRWGHFWAHDAALYDTTNKGSPPPLTGSPRSTD